MRRPAHALLALLVAVAASAAFPAAAGPDDSPVAKVGPVTITRGELERRMARVPAIQLSTLGHDKDSIIHAFLEKILIPEALLSQGARDQKLEARDDVRLRIEDAERGALMADLRKQYTEGSGISPEEVARLGTEMFDRQVRPALRPEDDGKFVAIDIRSGSFELDVDDYTAVMHLRTRLPCAEIWLEKVGQPAAYRLRRGQSALARS